MIPILAGAVSGLLLTLSLPKPDLYPLAWIALVPLLFVIARVSLARIPDQLAAVPTRKGPDLSGRRLVRQIFLASYTAGVVFFAGTFYWITETMIIYGGLSA